MKKNLVLIGFIALTGITYSQSNSNPWPTSGNVGIGTASPAFPLDVRTSGTDDGVRITQLGTSSAGLYLKSSSTNGREWSINSLGTASSHGVGNFSIYDITSGLNRFFIGGNGAAAGNIGIGTTTPIAKVNIFQTSGTALQIDQTNTGNYQYGQVINVSSDLTKALAIQRINGATATKVFQVFGNGQTQIGVKTSVAHSDAFLMVDGKIVCKDFYVTALSDWPDFVFKSTYKLPDLYEVQKYYQTNKHLPNVPTAEEIKEKGIQVGEISTIQMQKIEELTMYIIQLRTELDALKKETSKNK